MNKITSALLLITLPRTYICIVVQNFVTMNKNTAGNANGGFKNKNYYRSKDIGTIHL